MNIQTMLQLQAKTDVRLTAAGGSTFGIARGTVMLLGFVRDRDHVIARIVTGNAESHDLGVNVNDLEYRHQLNALIIEGAELVVLSDKPMRLEFEMLLGHVKFHERLVRRVSYGQIL